MQNLALIAPAVLTLISYRNTNRNYNFKLKDDDELIILRFKILPKSISGLT